MIINLITDLTVSTKVLDENNLFLNPFMGSSFENFGCSALGESLMPTCIKLAASAKIIIPIKKGDRVIKKKVIAFRVYD